MKSGKLAARRILAAGERRRLMRSCSGGAEGDGLRPGRKQTQPKLRTRQGNSSRSLRSAKAISPFGTLPQCGALAPRINRRGSPRQKIRCVVKTIRVARRSRVSGHEDDHQRRVEAMIGEKLVPSVDRRRADRASNGVR